MNTIHEWSAKIDECNYSETSIIRHSMGLKLDVKSQRLSDYPVLLSTVKHGDHNTVGLERMLDYRGVGLQTFHCT